MITLLELMLRSKENEWEGVESLQKIVLIISSRCISFRMIAEVKQC